MSEEKSLGQVAFEAARLSGQWGATTQEHRACWERAAQAVARQSVDDAGQELAEIVNRVKQDYIDIGKAQGAAEERAEIVAWLRTGGGGGGWGNPTRKDIARDIERGGHRKP